MNNFLIRFSDILFSLLGIILFFPFIFIICLINLILYRTNPIFLQERIYINNNTFIMLKLRTLPANTPDLPTHLINQKNTTNYLYILRKFKIDELPQLIHVLSGKMSLVGPRPCLKTQEELIYERSQRGIHMDKPGITGIAQVYGMNMSNPELLARFENKYHKNQSFCKYVFVIFLTLKFMMLSNSKR